MTRLTSRQRKLTYFVLIVALIIPINLIGRPSSTAPRVGPGAERSQDDVGGGKLAKLRNEYDLGESNLGDIDPSSATMNLVLVGLRGIAANKLWMDAIKYQEQKNWAALENNVKSIILLQPHFVKVWEYQGWNLAYNVSAEWDLVQDKYHWIKEGAKFSIRGTKRNAKNPELYWWVGNIIGDKIARHDAWMFMRKFFNPGAYDSSDPMVGDPKLREESDGAVIAPDEELNRDDRDNYIVAKDWFFYANDADSRVPQRRMAPIAFRQRPAKAQLAYAEMMQKEGRFDEKATMIKAWDTGLRNWESAYDEENRPGVGQEVFNTITGGRVKIGIDTSSESEVLELKRLDADPNQFSYSDKLKGVSFLRSVINYNYWKLRAEIERKGSTVDAHRNLYEGKKELVANNLDQAIQKLELGLRGFAKLFKEYPQLKDGDENMVEEIMIGVIAWRDARKLLGASDSRKTDELPWEDATSDEEKQLYDVLSELQKAKQDRMPEFRRTYKRESFNAQR